MADEKNKLYYGDNLDILRDRIADESVDLIYLDPPFNSKRSYNVLFRTKSGDDAQAQIEAFDDTWTWSQQSEAEYDHIIEGGAPAKVADAIIAMRGLLGDNDVLAYLVMMTARLVEMHKVLKPTGSLYLHCDPTSSHYLKIMCDAIFGGQQFQNEIIWYYKGAGISPKRWGRRHDVLLWYSKTKTWYFNPDPVRDEYAATTKDRFSHYIGNVRDGNDYGAQELNPLGKHPDDVWQIPIIAPSANERLGYPTQKPESLLERIILSSSAEGATVLDPFCGCGTSVAVSQKTGRHWIGIDISYLSIALVQERLTDEFGDDVAKAYDVVGIPRDLAGAQALLNTNAFDFERWAVTAIGGRANEKQVGDKGSDGVIRFPIDKRTVGRIVISVKGTSTVNPAMVRELRGTVERENAEMGVLLTLNAPTRGMIDEVNKSGHYTYELTGTEFPRLQLITVPEILAGKRLDCPAFYPAYTQAKRVIEPINQTALPI